MGVVYKARQVTLNRVVALKLILSGNQADERDRARFDAEAQALASMTLPNLLVLSLTLAAVPRYGFCPPPGRKRRKRVLLLTFAAAVGPVLGTLVGMAVKIVVQILVNDRLPEAPLARQVIWAVGVTLGWLLCSFSFALLGGVVSRRRQG